MTTNNKIFYERLKILRTHGILQPQMNVVDNYRSQNKSIIQWYYEVQELGFHYRLTDIQAALGVSQLNNIDKFLKKRKN